MASQKQSQSIQSQASAQHGPYPAPYAQSSRTRPAVLLACAVFIAVLSLYLLTLAPGVVGGDAGEHQFSAPLLGIPHATGYPLYVILGKVWTIVIPVGTIAWRMNLLSAVTGALAAAVTSLVVYRLLKPASAWPAALTAGLALAMGLTLWHWSTIAGVRALNVLFFALLTLAATIWQQQRHEGRTDAAGRTLAWLALTVGLSLAHHRTTLFYAPSLVAWVAWHDPRLLVQPRRLLPPLLLALAPLSLYLLLYWRGIHNPPYSHEEISDWQSFWFLVGAGDSSGLFLSIDPAFLPARLGFIWRDLLAQLSAPGAVLAGLGGLYLLWRRPGHFVMQGLLALLLVLFTLDFEVVNLNEAPTWYLMPAYFIFAVWLGVGLFALLRVEHRLWRLARRRQPPGPRRDQASPEGDLSSPDSQVVHPPNVPPVEPFPAYRPPLAASLFTTLIVLIILIAFLAWPNWQYLYRVSTRPMDEWRQLLRGAQAQRLVESSLPHVAPGSLILCDWEQYTPFKYYQLINGQRPDLEPRLPLDQWPEKVAAAHAAGQPVYFARKTTDLIGVPYLSMAGPLISLGVAPNTAAPANIDLVEANFENQLELIGYRAEVIPQPTPGGRRAGPVIQLMFYWRIPQPVTRDYALSLRLLGPAGQVIHQQDAAHPVLSSYPTSLWTPGEVVGDFYELPFPPGSGPVTLHLIPYRSAGQNQWHNLILEDTDPPQAGIILGPFREVGR